VRYAPAPLRYPYLFKKRKKNPSFSCKNRAMNIENIAIDALKPYPGNARTHDEAQIEALAAAIRELGFRDPVEVDDDNMILAGHGRVLAAHRAGLAQVPCVRHAGLTEAQKRAYVLSNNQIGLLSGWDEAALLKELDWLEAQDFDLTLTGFDGEDIQAMLDRLGLGESESAGDADEGESESQGQGEPDQGADGDLGPAPKPAHDPLPGIPVPLHVDCPRPLYERWKAAKVALGLQREPSWKTLQALIDRADIVRQEP
jgi:hypothetical protein